jgi:hypothetical protein
MLKQAEKNMDKEKLSDKVVLKEEDLTDLSFPDVRFCDSLDKLLALI